eukprot:gnl/TRDRNA2_/TRDRNA2_73958_c1_seq1.p1 gnl/TRDRNA2_/TRDRNA2_73958_c1~~gnl/TRDRNA2_/TRDRNA2_73958_c1_seq1.p1  ORF type:complete len:331 (-),score=19.10 gnl/TRDRNA2_/TRDRNA2_73958_c1_seq1:240-1154(-)
MSLTAHLRDPLHCTIHVVVAAEDLEEAEKVVALFRAQVRSRRGRDSPFVEVHEMRQPSLDFREHKDRAWPMKQHLYNLYYVHEYLPLEVPRVIWIDCDTIVTGDVAELYRKRMIHAVAAVPLKGRKSDRMRQLRDGAPTYMQKYFSGVKLDAPQYNFGVALYDLKQWRSGEISRALEYWTDRLEGYVSCHSPLNLEFHFRGIDAIDWRWNVFVNLADRAPERCLREAKVLHWAGHFKPWDSGRPMFAKRHDDLYACGVYGLPNPPCKGRIAWYPDHNGRVRNETYTDGRPPARLWSLRLLAWSA